MGPGGGPLPAASAPAAASRRSKEIEFAAGAAQRPLRLQADRPGRRSRRLAVRLRLGRRPAAAARPRPHLPHPLRRTRSGRQAGAALPAGRTCVARLDSESYSERCRAQEALERRGKDGVAAVVEALSEGRLGVRGRLHAVWVLAKVEGGGGREAVRPGEGRPRAARAGAGGPRHRRPGRPGAGAASLDAGAGRRRAGRAAGRAGRRTRRRGCSSRWSSPWAGCAGRTPRPGCARHLKKPDAALAHAAAVDPAPVGNWPAVLKLLDEPSSDPFRAIALRAVAEQYDAGARGRPDRAAEEGDRRGPAPRVRRRCWPASTRSRGPWTYWGFRPPPRPANTVAWERTEAIEQALDRALADRGPGRAAGRAAADAAREGAGPGGDARPLARRRSATPSTVAALLGALRGRPGGETRAAPGGRRPRPQADAGQPLLAAVALRRGAGRRRARAGCWRWPRRSRTARSSPSCCAPSGRGSCRAASKLLLGKLSSPDAEVRACAVGGAGRAGRCRRRTSRSASSSTTPTPASAPPRRWPPGKLRLRPAADRLLKLARDPDAEVRRSSLEALRRLREPRAWPVAVAALADAETAVQALECVGELGGPEQAGGRGRPGAAPARPRRSSPPRARSLAGWARAATATDGRRRRSSRRWPRSTAAAASCSAGTSAGRCAERRLAASSSAKRCRPARPAAGWRARPVRRGPTRASGSARRRPRAPGWLQRGGRRARRRRSSSSRPASAPATVWLERQGRLPARPARRARPVPRALRGDAGEGDEPRPRPADRREGAGRVPAPLPPQERHGRARTAGAGGPVAGRQPRARPARSSSTPRSRCASSATASATRASGSARS